MGDLNIFQDGVHNEAADGDVIISTASSLSIIDAPITAFGDIILSASGVDGDIITGGGQDPAVESYTGNIIMNGRKHIPKKQAKMRIK